MDNFISSLFLIMRSILIWARTASNIIRGNPFLLFTIGFVVLAMVIAVFGRIIHE